MAQQISPLLSPAELTQELPVSRDLWCAKNPGEWRDIYLQIGISTRKGVSIAHCISFLPQILDQPDLDVALSALVAIHCVWAIVWNNSQLSAIVRGPLRNEPLPNALLASTPWENGIPQFLENFRLILLDWNELFRPEMALVLERTLLNVHVSFEQVQLFAGKEGEEEARRMFPILRQWSTTSDARKAVWHAGQVLKAATHCASTHLRDFQAICLYHAGMTFWAYAVLLASPSGQQQLHPRCQSHPRACSGFGSAELVCLDGNDGPAVQKFVALGRGSPVINPLTSTSHSGLARPIHLEDQKAVMDVCIKLLRRKSPGEEDRSSLPLVENLSQLMGDLGNAAHELLHGGARRSREGQAASSS